MMLLNDHSNLFTSFRSIRYSDRNYVEFYELSIDLRDACKFTTRGETLRWKLKIYVFKATSLWITIMTRRKHNFNWTFDTDSCGDDPFKTISRLCSHTLRTVVWVWVWTQGICLSSCLSPRLALRFSRMEFPKTKLNRIVYSPAFFLHYILYDVWNNFVIR